MRGGYHPVLFPLILIEMEGGAPSLLGALDCVCLCCVCAGVCAAVALRAAAAAERAASRRAVRINLGFGDFVEACYPIMVRDRVVHAGALLGAAAGGAIVGGAGARSSAYLPLPVAVAISDEPAALAAAALAAFAVPFAVTLCRRH